MSKKGKISLANLVVNMLALVVVDYLVPGVTMGGFFSVVVAALLLMILNVLVKPILQIISLPVTCITLGLFEVFISAFILKIIDVLMASVHFSGIVSYILAVIVIAIINGIFNHD